MWINATHWMNELRQKDKDYIDKNPEARILITRAFCAGQLSQESEDHILFNKMKMLAGEIREI